MSENVIAKLREAIREERDNSGSYEQELGLAAWIQAANNTDAALAAVEQELAAPRRRCPDCGSPQPGDVCAVCQLALAERLVAELRADRDRCRRLYIEACELGSGHARIAALEDERDELRKRPTRDELVAAFKHWVLEDGHAQDPNDVADAVEIVESLYAEKAAQ